ETAAMDTHGAVAKKRPALPVPRGVRAVTNKLELSAVWGRESGWSDDFPFFSVAVLDETHAVVGGEAKVEIFDLAKGEATLAAPTARVNAVALLASRTL